MDEEPDRLKQDIEGTRASLTRDVDLLADKTSPKRVAQRRWTSVKEKVMGVTDSGRHAAGDAASTVQDTAAQVGDSVRQAPRAVAEQAKGNPLAAGIIAFGAGMLAATLIPATDAERRAGQQVKDNAGEVTGRVKDVATEMKDDLSGSVQHAAGEVKATAQDAAQAAKDQARSSAQDAREQAQRSTS
jgi:uncharacterized protein YjbJ (UPF0337 family)